MFLYNTQPFFVPGGFDIAPDLIEINKIDANGQEVGYEDLGASSIYWEPFTFEFKADGVPYSMECMNYDDTGETWFIFFENEFEGNLPPNEITFGGTPTSALFVLDVPVENAYVGDTPVVAMYVGKSKVFPLAEWRKFDVDVDKKVLGWVDDKYRIDYIITNNSEYPVSLKGFATPRFEMTLEPKQSHTAEFWAINEGETIDVRFEADTDTGYNFFVYEDVVDVPGKAPVEEWKWRLQADPPQSKPGYANADSGTDPYLRANKIDVDGKTFERNTDFVYEIDVNGVNKWRGNFKSLGNPYDYLTQKGIPNFPAFGTSGEITIKRLP